jgi:hypothetical protein
LDVPACLGTVPTSASSVVGFNFLLLHIQQITV